MVVGSEYSPATTIDMAIQYTCCETDGTPTALLGFWQAWLYTKANRAYLGSVRWLDIRAVDAFLNVKMSFESCCCSCAHHLVVSRSCSIIYFDICSAVSQ